MISPASWTRLAALISQCEGERAGKVGGVGAREGFGRVGLAVNSCKILQWFKKAAYGFHNPYYANDVRESETSEVVDIKSIRSSLRRSRI